jgi:hypothetical protein
MSNRRFALVGPSFSGGQNEDRRQLTCISGLHRGHGIHSGEIEALWLRRGEMIWGESQMGGWKGLSKDWNVEPSGAFLLLRLPIGGCWE